MQLRRPLLISSTRSSGTNDRLETAIARHSLRFAMITAGRWRSFRSHHIYVQRKSGKNPCSQGLSAAVKRAKTSTADFVLETERRVPIRSLSGASVVPVGKG
jgi:hypothetical protein